MARTLKPKVGLMAKIHKQINKRNKKKRLHQNLHGSFENIMTKHGLHHGMVPEHRFHPIRMFRFDFAWPHLKIGVELQGGIYYRGRSTGHTSISGMENDMEKLNLAVTNGWLLLQFSPNKVHHLPDYVASTVKATHRIRKPKQ